MSEQISIPSHHNTKLYLILIVLATIVVSSYYYFRMHYRDRQIADQVYQQLLELDGTLEVLQESATMISTHKALDSALVNSINGLSVDNFDDSRPLILAEAAKINYYPQLEAKFENQINAVDGRDPKLVKQQLSRLKVTVRELKFQQGIERSNFNQQVSQISRQLSRIQEQIKTIHASKLRQLELEKLKFISKKLAVTAQGINQHLYQSFFADIASTLEHDASDGM